MRVGQIRTNIEGIGDEVEIFAPWFDKSEANRYIEDSLCDGYKETEDLSREEWLFVVKRMTNDDGIWNELIESFKHYIDEVIKQRKEGNK